MKHLKGNFYGLFFRICRKIVSMIYPTYTVEIVENLQEPVVYVGHHQNLFGPFITLLWFKKNVHTWILHVFLDQKSCYQQYVDYTFTKRFGWNKIWAKMCAFPISYFIPFLLNSSRGIPVYRGSKKIVQTFKQSINALSNGESIVIFPDTDYSDDSSKIKEMYIGFLSLEKYYFKQTNRHVSFVPFYVSKNQRKIVADRQIYFRDGIPFQEEKINVYHKIQQELHRLAHICGD